jgi:hypothetical protein
MTENPYQAPLVDNERWIGRAEPRGPFAPWLFWGIISGFALGFCFEAFLLGIEPRQFGDDLLTSLAMGLFVSVSLSILAWRFIPWTPKP